MSRRPIAVALSGGGDSVALLRLAADWAKGAGRHLLVLTVDHRLQPESASWTQACAVLAAGLGASFEALNWAGDKPARGLPAAARAARHRLLATAAREAGAHVVLLGHTADDILEARAMRAEGSTTPEPRKWSPSPAWPEGRGVFLLRPLLGVRRAEVRAWLTVQGETWIEDPANADPRSARARARRDLAEHVLAPLVASTASAAALANACRMDAAGVLSLSRTALRAASPEAARLFVSAACLSAAGTTRPPGSEPLSALIARLASNEPVTATLAGARIEADDDEVRFLREPGEARRGGLQPVFVAADETAVWDGRFEITAGAAMGVRALGGLAARLSKAERASLQAFAPKARSALPVDEASMRLVAGRPLALERLRAACGLVDREPD